VFEGLADMQQLQQPQRRHQHRAQSAKHGLGLRATWVHGARGDGSRPDYNGPAELSLRALSHSKQRELMAC
jgi:hypothetical protein